MTDTNIKNRNNNGVGGGENCGNGAGALASPNPEVPDPAARYSQHDAAQRQSSSEKSEELFPGFVEEEHREHQPQRDGINAMQQAGEEMGADGLPVSTIAVSGV